MRRREFITLLGGTAAWPFAAQTQPVHRVRRAGMLLSGLAANPGWQARVAAFVQGLQQSGWIDGRNLRLDIRWSAGVAADTLKHAAELVALAPDVILASGSSALEPLQQVTLEDGVQSIAI